MQRAAHPCLNGLVRQVWLSTPCASPAAAAAPGASHELMMPTGDMAFVTAVAAFGQRLRGDKYLMGFGFSDIGALVGTSDNYWRTEFGKLVRLADAQFPRQPRGD